LIAFHGSRIDGNSYLIRTVSAHGSANSIVSGHVRADVTLARGRQEMIQVVLIADMVMFRSALATTLAAEEDLEIVGELSCTEAMREVRGMPLPDVAVVDFDARGAAAFTIVRALGRRIPDCRIIGLAGMTSPNGLRRALAAKVLGFMSKDSDPQRLAEAVRTVAAGGRVIEPGLAIAALSRPPNPLTSRETEVLRLVAEGLPMDEIAAKLYLSGGTVRNYLSSVIRKVGARNRIEAVRTAQESDWL